MSRSGSIKLTRSNDTGATEVPGEPSGSVGSKASLGVGLIGALVGSVCCLLPALALAAGIGGAAGLVQLGRYQPYLLAASLLLVVGWNWYLVERRKGCCTAVEQRRAMYVQAILSIAIFLMAYVAINYALVPWLYGIKSGGMPSM